MHYDDDKSKRWWRLQLRLSTAILLVSIIAVVCAWVVDHRQLRHAINKDADKLQQLTLNNSVLEVQLQHRKSEATAANSRIELLERARKQRLFQRSIHDEVTRRPFDITRAVPVP